MSFVNELASGADIEKYGLNDLWRRWNPLEKEIPKGCRFDWTVDHAREAYFKPMRSGREEHSNRHECVLFLEGGEWLIEIELEAGSSENFSERPFIRRWGLNQSQHIAGNTVSREQLIRVLKDALSVYGLWGIHKQIPNTVVEFAF